MLEQNEPSVQVEIATDCVAADFFVSSLETALSDERDIGRLNKTPLWAYVETLNGVELLRCRPSEVSELTGGSIAGRVFCELFEIRWLLRQEQEAYTVVNTRESAGRGWERTLRHYYLRGEVSRDNSEQLDARGRVQFHCGSLHVPLAYPVEVDWRSSKLDGRDPRLAKAAITVAEYRQCRDCVWPKEDDGLEEIHEFLNEPRVSHSRFVGVELKEK